MASSYRTAPAATRRLPPGIPYIVGNEAAERFSYYGMRTILVIFMTRYLRAADGSIDPMSEADALGYYHIFSSAVYFFPLMGALLADLFLGKYRTILLLSIVYCLGHLALALDETRAGLAVGLTLIAIGSGGIKPCVSAHVGDQFGESNRHLLQRVFGWFYFAINLGAFASSLLTPWLLHNVGAHAAFGVPGLLMLLASWVFWLGRGRFVHIPAGGREFLSELRAALGQGILLRLGVIYAFVAVFWSLYDQTGSAWVLQAEQMDRHFLGVEWYSSQIQAINPVLIMVFIPLFSYVVYPAIDGVFPLTALRKIGIGLFLTVVSFLVPLWIESRIAVGLVPNIAWQLLAYVILTAAEVFVSITCLEFSYTQAPRMMKSVIMSLYLLSVSAGNLFTSAVNFTIAAVDEGGRLSGTGYYAFFSAIMLVTALAFVLVARGYREQAYLQPEA
ncbi:MAG: POT family MFS transporter [Candidatus Binatia bacterium]